jgi:hypothetical protein
MGLWKPVLSSYVRGILLKPNHQVAVSYVIKSAGVLLFLTGLAKIISGLGSAHVLQLTDPILLVPIRYLFLGLGGVEVCVACLLFTRKNSILQASALAWLATMFAFYRISLKMLNIHKPCPCLGSITEALHISTDSADRIMTWVLLYLLAVGYGVLLLYGTQRMRRAF